MCRRLAAAMAFLTLLFALGVVAACGDVAAAGSDPQIVITGNPHVSADMIRSHFHAAKDGQFSPAALDAALKSLYATGLFSDVKISRDDSHIVVKVAENPTISRLAFEGNKKVKDDDLKKLELQSKTGGPLWRAYVQGDVERMAELYRQHGYFQARITPKTIKVRDARVDLMFEIKEGDKLAVRQILFSGNSAYPANKLEGVVKSGQTNIVSFLLDNDIYDADRIENDMDLLRQFYLTHGYVDVRVKSSASYDAAEKGVVLTFIVNEGPQYRLGTVGIELALKDGRRRLDALHPAHAGGQRLRCRCGEQDR